MTIILERGNWMIKASFNWYTEVSFNPSTHKFNFFASEKDIDNGDHSYNEAQELQKYLSGFLDFTFYTEEDTKKVIFHPKEDCRIVFKND